MLNFQKYFDFSILEEAAKPLSYKEFSKAATDKRGDRKKIFLQKYKDGQPFRVRKDGVEQDVIFTVDKDVVKKIQDLLVGNPISKSESYKEAEAIYNSIELSDVTSPGDKYKMKDLLKVGEFAGKGSGGGSAKTAINESSVCVWAAVYQSTKVASYNIVRKTAEKSNVSKHYNIDTPVKDLLEQKEQAWLDHYERVAEFLNDEVIGNGTYIFHKGSDLVKKIYKKYKSLNKLQQSPFGDDDKWNPADIWIQDTSITESEILSALEAAPDIMRLNNVLVDLYNQKKLIGVSLKKTGNKVHSSEFNTEKHNVKATLLALDPGSGTKGIFAKDCYIHGTYTYDSDKEVDFEIQFRSFTPWTDFQGEIKGSLAAGGRIGYGIINNILSRYNISPLPDKKEIAVKAADPNTNVDLLREIFEDYMYLGGKLTKSKDVNDFIEKVNTPGATPASEDYVFCKYIALKWLRLINSVNSITKNKILSDVMRYALSASDTSGPFIKVY